LRGLLAELNGRFEPKERKTYLPDFPGSCVEDPRNSMTTAARPKTCLRSGAPSPAYMCCRLDGVGQVRHGRCQNRAEDSMVLSLYGGRLFCLDSRFTASLAAKPERAGTKRTDER